jgi:hypothetical protein
MYSFRDIGKIIFLSWVTPLSPTDKKIFYKVDYYSNLHEHQCSKYQALAYK